MVNIKSSAVRKLDALTTLRFAAALLVFIYHTKIFESVLEPYRLGEIGVNFFFLLSGFILTYVYFSKLLVVKAKAILKFYSARFAKIFPMHVLTFLLAAPNMLRSYGAVLGGPIVPIVLIAAICNILLIQAYSNDPAILYSFNNVSWTISVEAFFYALFPFVIALIGKWRGSILNTHLLLVMLLLWVLMIIMNLSIPAQFVVLPIYRFPEFLIGVCAGTYFLRKTENTNPTTLTSSFLELGVLGLALLSTLLYPLVASHVSVATCLTPVLVAVILIFARERGVISSVLKCRPFVVLGEISFSFYMIHLMVLGHMNAIHGGWLALLALVVTVVLSMIFYYSYEEPMRKLIKAWSDKRLDARYRHS